MKLDDMILDVEQQIEIKAPPEKVFAAVLHRFGKGNTTPDGKSMQLLLEAKPGGRWHRDRGNGIGHLWGFVQVIKPPTLLELCGPMFMSFPAVNHVQYRLTAVGEGTRLTFIHRAMGPIPDEVREGVGHGWDYGLERIAEIASRLVTERRKGAK